MHTRSHYSDYTVIASHMFKQKRDNVEKTHTSELVLIINNWHFVKDNHTKTNVPPCRPDDCSVQIKISSTVFKSESQAGSSDLAEASANSEEYFFDKNGIIIPFPAFKDLLSNRDFQFYLGKVKQQFEEDTGVPAWLEEENEEHFLGFAALNEDVQSSQRVRSYLGGVDQEEEEEEEAEAEEADGPPNKVAKKGCAKGGGKSKNKK